MPRIPDQWLDATFYLYNSIDAAERGDACGGTGFIVTVSVDNGNPNLGVFYGITNKHVALTGSSVVRINCKSGAPDIFDFGPDQWTAHPAGDDLAIIPLALNSKHKFSSVTIDFFVTEEQMRSGHYGLGDPTFMIGRFIGHDGSKVNVPSISFGNLSIPASLMKREDGYQQLSFGVEMRSMKGYSGSPVFIHQDPWNLAANTYSPLGGSVKLLGIDWGQVTVPIEIKKYQAISYQSMGGTRLVDYIHQNTGMNGVIPAWKLMELLNHPAVVEGREIGYKNYLEAASKEIIVMNNN